MTPGRATAASSGDVPWLATDVARRMSNWGFLAHSDLPHGHGPAFLLVALRRTPTLNHFDPELIEYWSSTEEGRGVRRTLDWQTPAPRAEIVGWGEIRLVDRTGVSNDYVTFGGRVDAGVVDGVLLAAFTSPAPILARGGHSQPWDPGAEAAAAFLGRLRAAVCLSSDVERAIGAMPVTARYAAFVREQVEAAATAGRSARDDAARRLLHDEARRLRRAEPDQWAAGALVLAAAVAAQGRAGPSTRTRR